MEFDAAYCSHVLCRCNSLSVRQPESGLSDKKCLSPFLLELRMVIYSK
jgi:hypothetical protein